MSDLRTAIAERDEAMARIEANADATWTQVAAATVLRLARTGKHFTSDDVMDYMDTVDLAQDARALGPIMKRAIRLEHIHRVGYVPSRRRHATPIAQYVGII